MKCPEAIFPQGIFKIFLMKKLSIVLFVFILALSGCKPSASPDYMILDKVVYVEKFPQVFALTDGEPLDLGVLGANSLSVQDSLLIVSSSDPEGYWSFFSLPALEYKGKYLHNGNGPNEFLFSPWVDQQHFSTEQGALFADIYDYQTGKLYRMNVTETVRGGQLSIAPADHQLPCALFGFRVLGDGVFFCKEPNDAHTQQVRYLLDRGEKKSGRNMDQLNLASVSSDQDLNLLSLHTTSNGDGSRIVEAALALNQINLYSIDDSFGKTICTGKQIDHIGKVQDIGRPDRMYNYMDLRMHSDFFGALYLNDTDGNFELGTSRLPVIRIFDWDGNPLAEIQPERTITTYDIDFRNGWLFTLNYNTEEIYKYDIGEILGMLK